MTKLVSGKQALHYRNYRRARDRALVRLAHLYPDTYKQLLGIEKAFDEQENKKWIAVDGASTDYIRLVVYGLAATDLRWMAQLRVIQRGSNA